MKLFTNIRRLLFARVHLTITITPAPTHPAPLALLGGPIEDEKILQTAISFSEPAPPKPKRKRKVKVLQTALLTEKPKVARSALLNAATEPEPPAEDAWLRKLREKKRKPPYSSIEADNLPNTTSVAIVRDRTLYRMPDESVQSFVARVRSIIGDSLVDWGTEKPDKTCLDIVQDHLNRPLKANTDEDGWDQILPEDLVGMQGTHGTVH
jgi:hypothetical protein